MLTMQSKHQLPVQQMERAREKQHQSPGHQRPDVAKSSVANDFQHHNPYTNYYSFFAVLLLLLALGLAPLICSQSHSCLLAVSPVCSSLPLVCLLSCCNQSSNFTNLATFFSSSLPWL